MEQVKIELRAFKSIDKKKKWTKQGAPRESVNQTKSAPDPSKSLPAGLAEPYEKWGKVNHTTPKCQVGSNESMWCGSLEHPITACPQRLKAIDWGSNLQGSQL